MILSPESLVTDKCEVFTGTLKTKKRERPIGLYTKTVNYDIHYKDEKKKLL